LLDGIDLRTHFVSQAVNHRINPRNATRKSPVSLPHRNMGDHALAAFAMLRADEAAVRRSCANDCFRCLIAQIVGPATVL
jgi:hypothetical protein